MDTDATATPTELQQRAADDYAQAQANRSWQTNRDDANTRNGH